MNIAQILRERRVELGVSQSQLAKHCGFSHKSSISLREGGQAEWKMETIVKACEALKLEISIKEIE